MKTYDYCIIGAGFAGSATAYYLSELGAKNILLIEQEPRVGMHASGHNAAMLRQAVSDEAIARLAQESVHSIKAFSASLDIPLIQETGSLLLTDQDGDSQLDLIETIANRNHLDIEKLSAREVVNRVPLLKGGKFSQGLFCPGDGVVNIYRLLHFYIEGAQARGVTIQKGVKVERLQRGSEGYELVCPGQIFSARVVINASGAWSNTIARLAGLKPLPVTPSRRHLFFAPNVSEVKPSWPFVWNLSQGFYFRPEKNGLLMSACDEDACEPQSWAIDHSKEMGLREKMSQTLPSISDAPLHPPDAQLRTLSEDGRFFIGPDPQDGRFFWISGLGGHGVTTSAGVGHLAAQLLLDKKADPELASQFSPAR